MEAEILRLARAAAEQHIPPLIANPYHPCTVAYVRFLDAYDACL